MRREFPNLCINHSQLNQTVSGRQILGGNLENLNVIYAESPLEPRIAYFICSVEYVHSTKVCSQTERNMCHRQTLCISSLPSHNVSAIAARQKWHCR